MKAYVAGVGMTRFEKPETREWQYWDMVREAV
jgi:acetyl-CoA acyltransferase